MVISSSKTDAERETTTGQGQDRKVRTRRRRHPVSRLGVLVMYLVGIVFAGAAIISIAVGWRLSQGPLKVSFLTPLVQQSATQLPENWNLTIGDSFIRWDGETQTLQVRVEDVGFINANQQKVVSIPDAGFSIHGDALLKGRVEPRQLTATGVNLVVTRDEGNAWQLGIGPGDRTRDEAEPDTAPQRAIADLAADLFGQQRADGTRQGILGRLEEFLLIDTNITVVDRIRDRVYGIEASELRLRGLKAGIDVRAVTRLKVRDFELPLRASLVYFPETETVRGAIRFAQLRLPDLVDPLEAPAAFAGLKFPVSGSLGFQVSATDGFGAMPLKIETGAGTFGLPGQLAGPLPMKKALLEGSLIPKDRELKIKSLTYDSGEFLAEAFGAARMTLEGPDINLNIVGTDVPLTRVPDYWPPNHGANVRNWLLKHVKAGTAGTVNAKLNMKPDMWRKDVPDADSFDISFDYREADIDLYAPFDGVRNASGELHVTGRELQIRIASGDIAEMAVTDGVVTIENFAEPAPELTAEFVATSTVQGTVRSILRGPLATAAIDPALLRGVEGQMAARIRLSIDVASNTQLSDTRFVANANLAAISVPESLLGAPLTAKALSLKLDAEGAELAGVVNSGNSLLDLQWVERFSESIPFHRQVAFEGTVDVADLTRFQPDIVRYVGGTVGVHGGVFFDRTGLTTLDVDLNLMQSAAQIEDLRWYKPVGQPANVKLQAALDELGAIKLSSIEASSDDLNVSGDINLNGDGQLLGLRLERADLGDTRMSLVVRRVEGGKLGLQIVGEQLDLRPWISSDVDTPSDSIMAGASVELAVGRLILDDRFALHDAVGEMVLAEPQPVGTLRGVLNDKVGVQAFTKITPKGWAFDLTSGDAGAMLEALGLGDAITGGKMRLRGTQSRDQKVVGLASIDDFALTETPVFARMFSLASFTGIGEALSGDGLSFTRAELPFTYADQRLDFSKGRMAGPSVGLTADGYFDFETEEIRAVGNLIPAYSLSQVLGAIPLLGTILGGDQGLFGVTYAVEGTTDRPKVTVNPLSALAPGILRRMFLESVEPQELEEYDPVEQAGDR